MKTISAIVLLLTGVAFGMPAIAETAAPAQKTKKEKAPAKKPASKKAAAAAGAAGAAGAAAADGDDKEPDVAGLTATAFDCELGNKLTIYQMADQDQIALHWNKRLHHMTRVTTTTGAHRFENTKKGLVWIGIPAKGMLLDSKKGQQLANECKSLEQVQAKTAEKG
ncbi:hypothetical protein RY831_29355 [Noviherbaspirillum sp. CPCC 100848]|uniref:C-type lysozyme inhibitor domain-containing protein n=1 Tax=Noviherbaspirillum album TaxID=3080276 RepID=A0ABU6JJP3_9BURK|nr:hypothetical protein [Noviherbaspirillum sp. CPCC 100848]MEC4723269.1 hypothetical protein [Noviherbaspirillum sp. CPCC 100848]